MTGVRRGPWRPLWTITAAATIAAALLWADPTGYLLGPWIMTCALYATATAARA